ncbi:MAG: nucleotidyltransferase domain-containing protein [Campylobacterota bacterium]
MRELTIEQILSVIQELNEEYAGTGFKLVGVFGSYARGENAPTSDIDIAYEIDQQRFHKDNAFAQLEEMGKIRTVLEKRFQRKVDLVSFKSNNIVFKERISKEMLTA